MKCGVDSPYNLSSNLCHECHEAQKRKNVKGGLCVLLVFGSIFSLPGLIFMTLGFWYFILSIFAIVLVLSITALVQTSMTRSKLNPEEREEFDRCLLLGPIRPQIVCTHCQVQGRVRTKGIEKDAGISGKKATAAALTGGISILATGLSRKEQLTQAHCDNCGSTWTY
jgi:hypothetical protein